ncbi:MAG: choice-of-anchor Q domain-containing protein [Xenococcaceae cyanobacterium]
METIVLTVNTTADENDGGNEGTGLSLRDAIITVLQAVAEANSSGVELEDEYIIELEGGSTYNLTLNGGDLLSGDLDVTGNVTIRAKGDEAAIIDASGLTERDRVFDIGNGNVNLERLIITGGRAEPSSSAAGEDSGGGIRVLPNANLTMSESLVFNNFAVATGGGIASAANSTVTLIDSWIDNNQANDDGGGIATSSSNFIIRNSQISRNVGNLKVFALAGGGGISNLEGYLRIEDSSIESNTGYDGGGGIFNNADLDILNTEIRDNISIGDSLAHGYGGGIHNRGNLVIRSSNIHHNNTRNTFSGTADGGGIYTSRGIVRIIETTISNNTTRGLGGGINLTGGEVGIYSSTISGNIAAKGSLYNEGGGGISNGDASRSGGILRVINSTVSGNRTSGNGGGIQNTTVGGLANPNAPSNSRQQTFIINSTIVNNTANEEGDNRGLGGGVANNLESDRLIIENSIIAGNFSSGGNVSSDLFGSITGARNNLIGNLDRAEGTIGTGSDIVNPDVRLTPLQDNGGETLTHALLEGSPAIDAGNNSNIFPDRFDFDGDENSEESLPFDQLGNLRIANETVDIGAIEFGATSPNPDTDNTALRLTGGTAQIAYVAYYGRPADKGGLDFWNDALTENNVSYAPREGDSLTGSTKAIYDSIVNQFGTSAEADRLFGNIENNRDKVNRVYQLAFNRDGDSEGLNYWTEQIDNGNVTLATFALEVALGAQNEDIVILNNKIDSADLFANSLDTQAKTAAYSGSEGEIFGREWLSNFGDMVSTQTQVDEALADLVDG